MIYFFPVNIVFVFCSLSNSHVNQNVLYAVCHQICVDVYNKMYENTWLVEFALEELDFLILMYEESSSFSCICLLPHS